MSSKEIFSGNAAVRSLACSPDGQCVLFATGNSVYVLEQLDSVANQVIKVEKEVESLAFAPDSASFCITIRGGDIIFFDCNTYQQTNRIRTKQPGFHTVQWSPNGQYICVGHYEPQITVINTDSFKVIATLDPEIFTDRGRTCVLFSLVDNQLLSTAYNTICIWEVRKGKYQLANKLSTNRDGHLIDLALSPDNLRIAALEDCENTCYIHLWRLVSGRQIKSRGLPHFANRITWSPDGQRIAVGEFQGNGISFWDPANLENHPVSVSIPVLMSVQSLAFHPEGRLLFAGTEDGRLLSYDIMSN